MITLDEAQVRLFALRKAVEIEDVALAEAVGRWAGTELQALRMQPARNLSAMDGYAIRSADTSGPWTIIGESAAGRMFDGTVGAAQAVRIFTGAVVPEGADSILIQENAEVDDGRLVLTTDLPLPGQHVRRAGGDFDRGDTLIRAGEHWTAARIGLAAMGGYATVPVRRRLRLAIISTGDELVKPGEHCADYQTPSSNAPMLAAMLATMPVDVTVRPIVRDDLASLKAEFSACSNFDVIVSIGGASVGDHDLVRPALEASGAKLDFWKIAMRPGKPVMAGKLGDAIVLGLPGNPVSAFVTALMILKPLIAHLSGANNPLPKRIEARLDTSLPANGTRIDFVRGRLEGSVATPIGTNDSSMMAALSYSNILIIRDINSKAACAEDLVHCIHTH